MNETLQHQSENRTVELFADFARDEVNGSVTVVYNFQQGQLKQVEISTRRVERMTEPPPQEANRT